MGKTEVEGDMRSHLKQIEAHFLKDPEIARPTLKLIDLDC